MFIEGGIIGLILGKVRGGRFSNFSYLSIRAWPLIFLAFFIQVSPAFTNKISALSSFQGYAYGLSNGVIILLLLFNLNKRGLKVMLAGLLLNLVAVYFNGWKIPVSMEGLQLAGLDAMVEAIQSGKIANYIPLDSLQHWSKYLAKFIVIPKPYPLAKVISIGDLFITLGLTLFIYGEMTKNHLHSRSRMIKFGYKGTI
ncbi:DUF5317 family protein [Geosporobacter ferrireducens]|uniref:DUF5317 domain-containing protein n=1 Tax=Geosporobacter ferrireducens TaxID=1424294 RepID=A0A1D8GGF6_9FIRM|nr:DUF5317 family protein [Geosporobacter ferrireducens]AOT70010.1 hypothetical protein Gferi_10675 [Geosporobacter ferrireducens]MTI53446.1 hypothetical protein [Geosporobacter ferrireducens]